MRLPRRGTQNSSKAPGQSQQTLEGPSGDIAGQSGGADEGAGMGDANGHQEPGHR